MDESFGRKLESVSRINASERLIVALDLPGIEEARKLVEALDGVLGLRRQEAESPLSGFPTVARTRSKLL